MQTMVIKPMAEISFQFHSTVKKNIISRKEFIFNGIKVIKKFNLILVILVIFSSLVYADSESSIFNKFDNNISVGATYGWNGTYNNIGFIVEGTLLKHDIWIDVAGSGYNNYQATYLDPSRISSGMDILGKLGYSIVLGSRVNLIPYIGLQYGSNTNELHYNSQPIFTMNNTYTNYLIGLHPEVAIGSMVKLAFDLQLDASTQNAILPNTTTTLAHQAATSYGTAFTTSIQITPYRNLNLEIYTRMDVSSNSTTANVDVTHGPYDSYQEAWNTNNTFSTVGFKVGWLF